MFEVSNHKNKLTIPRLEPVAGHMAANLVTNVEEALGRDMVTAVHAWLDSTVALYWINGRGGGGGGVLSVRAQSSIENT